MPIQERFSELCDRIEAARRSSATAAGRVTLVAVSKNQPLESLEAAYDAGIREFGESRLQEALPKMDALPGDVRWHFVGNIQSNKARRIAERFDVVHSLCRVDHAAEMAKAGRRLDAFLEINVAEEPQKGGVTPDLLDETISLLLNWQHVRLHGLMTVGPAGLEPEAMRPFFRKMREWRDRWVPGGCLSMGMSGDFEVAIQEGATHVRIGTALFGPRNN